MTSRCLFLLVLVGPVVLCGCDAEQSRGSTESCEEKLRAALPVWHSQVEATAQNLRQAADTRPADAGALRRAQTEFQLSAWAANSAAIAHLQYRVYGGDTSRNKANDLDAAAARRRAVEASRLALDMMSHPPEPLRRAVGEMVRACH